MKSKDITVSPGVPGLFVPSRGSTLGVEVLQSVANTTRSPASIVPCKVMLAFQPAVMVVGYISVITEAEVVVVQLTGCPKHRIREMSIAAALLGCPEK